MPREVTVVGKRILFAALAAFAIIAAAAEPAAAQSYPNRPVKIIVPFAPGGPTEFIIRLTADRLTGMLGQAFVIENRPGGGGGTVGAKSVAVAEPDGYTLLFSSPGPLVTAAAIYKNLDYDPIKSFAPIAMVIYAPQMLVVHPSVPATTVPEFVAWLKAQDGKVSYASSGTGQSPHLSGAWFLQLTGTKAEHIPYRGAAPALQDLTAGVTQFFFDNLTTGIEFVRAGKLRALGITSAQRNPLTPELVPICETMPELKPFDVSTWFGVFLPAGTPRPIVDSLNTQMKIWLDDAKTQERFKSMAGFPVYGTPEQFDAFVNAQIALWKSVIDKEGLKLDVN